MRPTDDIKRLLDESRLASAPEVDRRILADALEDLEKRRKAGSTDPGPGVWRIVMNGKITRLAVAAAIVIAVLIGLQVWSPLGSNVTFAQAIQPILNANTAILDIIIGEETDSTPIIHDMIMGSRIRRTVSNIPGNVSIIDLESLRLLNLTEENREAAYIDLKGLPSIPNHLDNLKNLMVMLQDSPEFAVEDLGTRQIDGTEAVGFFARHSRGAITLWADARTGLPVRIEQEAGQLRTVCKNVQFDVPMSEDLFSMEVPEGYSLQEMELDLRGATEEDFIEGLRVLAEAFNDGRFPDDVSLGAFMKQTGEIVEKIETLGLSKEEQTELGAKLQKYVLFTRFFKGQGKWYYRGQGIRLGEAETPIFWYRPKGSETYRVIYGDLHVEDAAPEDLPEPLDPNDVAEVTLGYKEWHEPDFVGRQEDLWRITGSGQVVAQSEVTLMKGPRGVFIVPIRLPYATGVLTSATLGDIPVPFEQVGAGRYTLHLPVDELLSGRTKLTCTWTLPLTDLKETDYGYQVVLRSLIPVVSYRLTAALDADSGLEFTKAPGQSTWVPFSIGNPPKPMADFGRCGIAVRRRD